MSKSLSEIEDNGYDAYFYFGYVKEDNPYDEVSQKEEYDTWEAGRLNALNDTGS
jgi:hypothetical protein